MADNLDERKTIIREIVNECLAISDSCRMPCNLSNVGVGNVFEALLNQRIAKLEKVGEGNTTITNIINIHLPENYDIYNMDI